MRSKSLQQGKNADRTNVTEIQNNKSDPLIFYSLLHFVNPCHKNHFDLSHEAYIFLILWYNVRDHTATSPRRLTLNGNTPNLEQILPTYFLAPRGDPCPRCVTCIWVYSLFAWSQSCMEAFYNLVGRSQLGRNYICYSLVKIVRIRGGKHKLKSCHSESSCNAFQTCSLWCKKYDKSVKNHSRLTPYKSSWIIQRCLIR